MADLDRDLSNRLARLADAVPVSSGRLDPVHRGAVEARQRVRLAWVTPLVVLAIGGLFVGLTKLGPISPAPHVSPNPSTAGSVISTPSSRPSTEPAPESGPPVSASRDGDFELVLQAAKTHYAPDEPIEASAALTYRGSKPAVEISTDMTGPINFGIRERVFGALSIGGMSLLTCEASTLTRDEPRSEPFEKSGSFDGEHPQADQFRAFFEDPELRLPEGTWHLYARASAGCMDNGPAFDLLTEIQIVVDDDPSATPGHPAATAWADKPVYGGDDVGNMIFQVRSEHPTYQAGDPVELDTYYWFSEGPPRAEQAFIQEAAFSIVQLDQAAVEIRSTEPQVGCAQTSLTRGEERHVPIHDRDVVVITAVSWPQTSADALAKGRLELPIGRWRLTAVVSAHFGPCGAPEETWQVHASVEIDVLPAP